MSERQSISLRHHQEGTMYFSGIDQHKRDCVITTYAGDGQRVKQQRVPNEPVRLRAYFAAFPGPTERWSSRPASGTGSRTYSTTSAATSPWPTRRTSRPSPPPRSSPPPNSAGLPIRC